MGFFSDNGELQPHQVQTKMRDKFSGYLVKSPRIRWLGFLVGSLLSGRIFFHCGEKSYVWVCLVGVASQKKPYIAPTLL